MSGVRGASPVREQAQVLAIQVALVLAALVAWEVLTRWRVLQPFYFGQPTQVFRYAAEKLRDGSLPAATWITLLETLAGFALGMGVGTLLGFSLWWSRTVTKVIEPLLVALNAVPKLIFAPIFLLLIGLGFAFKVAISFAGVAVVALLSAFAGTKQADPDHRDLIRSMGGTRWQVFTLVVVPTALPWVVISMEMNVGFALIGAVVGEFPASNAGLGYLAIYASGTFDMSLVLVSVATLMVLAALMYGAVRKLETILLPWRPEGAPSMT
jgi:NitT/TauT family transport system permease protein